MHRYVRKEFSDRGVQATHQRVSSLQISLGEGLAILVNKVKRPADLGLPNRLVRLGHPLLLHAFLLMFEVPSQAGRCCDEQQESLYREGLYVKDPMLASEPFCSYALKICPQRACGRATDYAYPDLVPTLGLLNRLVLESFLHQGLMPLMLVKGPYKRWSPGGRALRRGREELSALSRRLLDFLEAPQQCPRRGH